MSKKTFFTIRLILSFSLYSYEIQRGDNLSKVLSQMLDGRIYGENGNLQRLLSLNNEIKQENLIKEKQIVILPKNEIVSVNLSRVEFAVEKPIMFSSLVERYFYLGTRGLKYHLNELLYLNNFSTDFLVTDRLELNIKPEHKLILKPSTVLSDVAVQEISQKSVMEDKSIEKLDHENIVSSKPIPKKIWYSAGILFEFFSNSMEDNVTSSVAGLNSDLIYGISGRLGKEWRNLLVTSFFLDAKKITFSEIQNAKIEAPNFLYSFGIQMRLPIVNQLLFHSIAIKAEQSIFPSAFADSVLVFEKYNSVGLEYSLEYDFLEFQDDNLYAGLAIKYRPESVFDALKIQSEFGFGGELGMRMKENSIVSDVKIKYFHMVEQTTEISKINRSLQLSIFRSF